MALTKLDVLSAFDTIKVCTAYECEGKVCNITSPCSRALFHAKPVYEELPGWKGVDIECRTFEELPENAQRYVEYLEKITGVPVSIIAVGPDRDQTIMREAGRDLWTKFRRSVERRNISTLRSADARSRGDADGSRTGIPWDFGARFASPSPRSRAPRRFADV